MLQVIQGITTETLTHDFKSQDARRWGTVQVDYDGSGELSFDEFETCLEGSLYHKVAESLEFW